MLHTLGEVIGCNLYLMVSEDLPGWPMQGRICIYDNLPHATAQSSGELEDTERIQCGYRLLRFDPQQLKKRIPPRTGLWLIRIRSSTRFFGRTTFWFWTLEKIILKNTNRGIHLVLHFLRPKPRNLMKQENPTRDKNLGGQNVGNGCGR